MTRRHAFEVGNSPFHAKGVAYRDFLGYVDEVVTGGRKELFSTLREEPLRRFAEQAFLPSSWYDALPIMELCTVAAKMVGSPALTFTRDMARYCVQQEVKGIYRFLIKLSSPEGLLERAPLTSKQYYDFVTTEAEAVSSKRYRLTHSGVPDFAIPFYKSIAEGFIECALSMAGARDVHQFWQPPTSAGTKGDVQLVSLQRDISWR